MIRNRLGHSAHVLLKDGDSITDLGNVTISTHLSGSLRALVCLCVVGILVLVPALPAEAGPARPPNASVNGGPNGGGGPPPPGQRGDASGNQAPSRPKSGMHNAKKASSHPGNAPRGNRGPQRGHGGGREQEQEPELKTEVDVPDPEPREETAPAPVATSPPPAAAPDEPARPEFRFTRSARAPEGAPAVTEPTPVDVGPVTDRLSHPFVERALDLLPEPAVPSFPPASDPTVPLLLVVALAAYALVVARGDRRDPKLARSAVDPSSRGLGFK